MVMINIVTYRPTKTQQEEFSIIISEVEEILKNLKKPEPTVK